MNTESENAVALATHKAVNLRVRYLGARRPFEDPQASTDETLAQLKPRALGFFGLKEGSADGGTKVYEFAMDAEVLSDLSATLGSLAEDRRELKLDLVERFEQG